MIKTVLGGMLGARIVCATAIGTLNAAGALVTACALCISLVGLSPLLVAASAAAAFTHVPRRPVALTSERTRAEVR